MRRVALALWAGTLLGMLILSLTGCETVVRNVLAPAVEELLDEKKPGEDPKGGGHGRGGSKADTTAIPPPADTTGFGF